MKSPENKTLSFIFRAIPVKNVPDFWEVRVTIHPGSTADTPITFMATDGTNQPIAKGTFEFMGSRIKIVNGKGAIPYGDFVEGIHEKSVWMMRPDHPPVPGALTFA